jgi:hypothetical protein
MFHVEHEREHVSSWLDIRCRTPREDLWGQASYPSRPSRPGNELVRRLSWDDLVLRRLRKITVFHVEHSSAESSNLDRHSRNCLTWTTFMQYANYCDLDNMAQAKLLPTCYCLGTYG